LIDRVESPSVASTRRANLVTDRAQALGISVTTVGAPWCPGTSDFVIATNDGLRHRKPPGGQHGWDWLDTNSRAQLPKLNTGVLFPLIRSKLPTALRRACRRD
jgi:hypothetical protein